jgi:hypothetical protein
MKLILFILGIFCSIQGLFAAHRPQVTSLWSIMQKFFRCRNAGNEFLWPLCFWCGCLQGGGCRGGDMQYVAAFGARTGDTVCIGARDPDRIKQKKGRLENLGPPVLTFKPGFTSYLLLTSAY